MKKVSLLLSLSLMMLFGFRAHSQTISISDGLTSDTVCSGLSVTFTADTTGAGPFGYTWVLNGTNVGTSSPSFTATLSTGINTIFCRLSSADFTTYYASSDTLTITVDSLPTTSPITGPTPASVCVGSTISLTDATTGGTWASANTSYATVDGSGNVTGVSLPAAGFGGPPSVRIYYILTNSCGSDSVRIRVSVAAPPSQIMTSAIGSVCIDSSISISDSSAGGSWSVSNGAVGSVGFQIGAGFPPTFGEGFTGLAAGTTTIYFNDTNACGIFLDSTSITVINCSTGIANVNTIANSCNIFPNPSTGAITIVANSDKYTKANCTIANMMGSKIQEFTINTNQESSVNLNIPSGVYFITVSAGNEKYTNKVIIME